jgi:hypothetical protein
MDSAYHKARADLLRIHRRNMARLRAYRRRQVNRAKHIWRKKVLKYNHHPKPNNSRYSKASLNKLRKRIHHYDSMAAALRRSIRVLKSRYRRKAHAFDRSRVRNSADFKEERSKIGTLMKKLHRAKRETHAVSNILDRFD